MQKDQENANTFNYKRATNDQSSVLHIWRWLKKIIKSMNINKIYKEYLITQKIK